MSGDLHSIIEQIRIVTDALIDYSIAQPHDKLLKHLQEHLPSFYPKAYELMLRDGDRYISEIDSWVQPYGLPQDYREFVRYYGGMLLSDNESYHLVVDGVGPMVEEWYSYLMGDDGEYESGFLRIGFQHIYNQPSHAVLFWLDIAGSIQKGAVFYTFRNSREYEWLFCAATFTDFLASISHGHIPFDAK